jgi:hypothetical protein
MYDEQGNKQQQQVDQEAAAAQVEAIFSSMGQTMLGLAQRQAEHAQVINEVVADRNQQQLESRETIGVLAKGIVDLETLAKAQGEMLRAMDTRIRLQQELIDHDHAILIKAGLATPRPKADPLAN